MFLSLILFQALNAAKASAPQCGSTPTLVTRPTEFGPANGALVALPNLIPNQILCAEQYRFVQFGKPNPSSRFSPTLNPDPWTVPKPAPQIALNPFGQLPNVCSQNQGNGFFGPNSPSQDCFFMRIGFIPAAGASQPVIVYFHGGTFRDGDMSIYPSMFLAARSSAVVVVAQYRLGLTGSLFVEDTSAQGNQMLQDQRLALEWVQRNIANFNGDPTRVTIMGQSAGASSVLAHMTSKPEIRNGLFHRAVSLSAPAGIFFQTKETHVPVNQFTVQASVDLQTPCPLIPQNRTICFKIEGVVFKDSKFRRKAEKNGYKIAVDLCGDANKCRRETRELPVSSSSHPDPICVTEGTQYRVSIIIPTKKKKKRLLSFTKKITINNCKKTTAPIKLKLFKADKSSSSDSSANREKVGNLMLSYYAFNQGNQDFVDCLSNLTDTQIIDIQNRVSQIARAVAEGEIQSGQSNFGFLLRSFFLFTPTVDECGVLPQQPMNAYEDGNFSETIPLIIGSCRDDGFTYVPGFARGLNPTQYLGLLGLVNVPQVLLSDPALTCQVAPCDLQVSAFVTRGIFQCAAYEFARQYRDVKQVSNGGFVYRLTEIPGSDHWGCGSDADPTNALVCHACDIPYVWNFGAVVVAASQFLDPSIVARFTFNQADQAVSADIQSFLGTFASVGVPGVSPINQEVFGAVNAPPNDFCGKWEFPFVSLNGTEEAVCGLYGLLDLPGTPFGPNN